MTSTLGNLLALKKEMIGENTACILFEVKVREKAKEAKEDAGSVEEITAGQSVHSSPQRYNSPKLPKGRRHTDKRDKGRMTDKRGIRAQGTHGDPMFQ